MRNHFGVGAGLAKNYKQKSPEQISLMLHTTCHMPHSTCLLPVSPLFSIFSLFHTHTKAKKQKQKQTGISLRCKQINCWFVLALIVLVLLGILTETDSDSDSVSTHTHAHTKQTHTQTRPKILGVLQNRATCHTLFANNWELSDGWTGGISVPI